MDSVFEKLPDIDMVWCRLAANAILLVNIIQCKHLFKKKERNKTNNKLTKKTIDKTKHRLGRTLT